MGNSYLIETTTDTEFLNKRNLSSKENSLTPQKLSDMVSQNLHKQENSSTKTNTNNFDELNKRLTEAQQTKSHTTSVNLSHFLHWPLVLQKFVTMIPHVE